VRCEGQCFNAHIFRQQSLSISAGATRSMPSSGTKEHDASRGDAAVGDRLVPELTVDGSPEAIAIRPMNRQIGPLAEQDCGPQDRA
jgi:hypothetical protein